MSGRALILCICVAGAAGMGQLGWSGVGLNANDLLGAEGACSRGGAAAASGSPMRLRGGAAAAVASKGPDLGEWKGRNVGPHAKRLLRTRTSAIASIHVQARFVIDCGRPHADNLLNVEELLTYLQDNIKVQNIRGNLGPRKRAEPQDRITVQIEKVTRIVVTSRVRLSKKYIKWLVKKYLYGRGMRNFMWCVMGSKHSYQLRYYNFEDLKSIAASESIAITQEVGGDDDDGEGEDDEALAGDEEELKDTQA